MTRRAEHLPEAQFALRNQFGILAPCCNNGWRNLVRGEGLGFLNAKVSRQCAKLRFGEPELRHARLFFGLVAVDGDVAILVHDCARIFQPLVNPFAADFRADAGKVRAEHRGPLDSLKDRKSTRLNSSHPSISYAVFCLKKKIYKTITSQRVNAKSR